MKSVTAFCKSQKIAFSKSMEGPAFSNSSFSAKNLCSEKLLLDLPNNFSHAFQLLFTPNSTVVFHTMVV